MAVSRNALTASTRPATTRVGSTRLHRMLLGSVASLVASMETASIALAQGAYGGTPTPSPSDTGPMQLPTVAVEGAEKTTQSGYKADQPSLGKLTEPLLDTPFTIDRP